MARMNIFEFLEMCYMNWEFWAGVIIGIILGFAFCKLTTIKEIKTKNDELVDYRNEIRELKKEINELKIANAISEYYAKRDKE